MPLGPRDATFYRWACINEDINAQLFKQSEDCLYLNIATAWKSGPKLPVMIFIHGGADNSGAAENVPIESLVLASQGSVVVVSLDYRLNLFGFLGSAVLAEEQNGGTGNYGIEDQRMAMKWVKDHIEAFGGDSSNITIFGESAGGNAVLVHLTQPASFGLYDRAIIESGTSTEAMPMEEAEHWFQTLLKVTLCPDLVCLRLIPFTTLAALNWPPHFGKLPVKLWGPVIGGAPGFDTTPQDLVLQGKYNNKVPVMLGSNRDEFSLFMADPELVERYPADLNQSRFEQEVLASGCNKSLLAEFERLYMPPQDDYPTNFGSVNVSSWWWMTMRIVTDFGINQTFNSPYRAGQPAMGMGHCGVRCIAHAFEQGGTPGVFTYLFAHPTQEAFIPGANEGNPLWTQFPGSPFVSHASELFYVFNLNTKLGVLNGEVALARKMSTYWVQFAKKGDPNVDGLPYWPQYEPANDTTMQFDVGPTGTRPIENYIAAKCDAYDRSTPVCNSWSKPKKATSRTQELLV
jgi:para-nitrobenzyl esterase